MNGSNAVGMRKNPVYRNIPRFQGGDPGRLTGEQLDKLRMEIVPNFMREAGIVDLTTAGFRMVVDCAMPKFFPPTVHLMAGRGVPNLNPQDWLTPQGTSWNPNEAAPFFDSCIEAARIRAEKIIYGIQIHYIERENEFFGVADGDPKSDVHFLMMATQRFNTMMDNGFTAEYWKRCFGGAYQILEKLGFSDRPTRYTANFGAGFKTAPWMNLHVQNAKKLPKMFPFDYGFAVSENGTVTAPEDSELHQELIRLIASRQEVQGFGEAAKIQRNAIDKKILGKLRELECSNA